MEGHTEGSDDLSIDGTTDPVTVGLLVASRVDGCIVEPSELGEVGSVEGEFEEFIFDGAEVNCIVGVDDAMIDGRLEGFLDIVALGMAEGCCEYPRDADGVIDWIGDWVVMGSIGPTEGEIVGILEVFDVGVADGSRDKSSVGALDAREDG